MFDLDLFNVSNIYRLISGGDRSNSGCKQASNLSDSIMWVLLAWFFGLLINYLKTKKAH